MRRRGFLKGLAAALAAAPTLPAVARIAGEHLDALARDLRAAADEPAFWGRVQREFSLREGLLHFNNGSIGPTPVCIQAAHKAYLDLLETDPYDYTWSGLPDHPLAQVQEQAAAFLNAGTDEVFLTRNTTEGMNLIATGMRLEPGDEVLTTDHEHPGGVWCWLHMAHLHGTRVRQVHLPTPAPSKADLVARIEAGITPRTRVVSISHVNTTTGLRMPVAEIAALAHARGILLVCDGAQAPGMLAVDVKELQVDAYASSSHKWLLAPKGSGLLYVRREAQDRIKPVSVYAGSGGGSYYAPYTAGSGTRNTPALLAHGLTLRFHELLGKERVQARALALNRYLRARLAPIAALAPVTPEDPELCSAMVSYQVQTMPVEALYQALHERGILIKRTAYNSVLADNAIPRENVAIIRLSTHVYNSEEQIDRLAAALAEILGTDTAVLAPQAAVPQRVALDPTYPNPFNASATIRYRLPAAQRVQVAVLNAQGQVVDVLADGWQAAGEHALSWSAAHRATGPYYCRLIAGADQQVRKMLLLR